MCIYIYIYIYIYIHICTHVWCRLTVAFWCSLRVSDESLFSYCNNNSYCNDDSYCNNESNCNKDNSYRNNINDNDNNNNNNNNNNNSYCRYSRTALTGSDESRGRPAWHGVRIFIEINPKP